MSLDAVSDLIRRRLGDGTRTAGHLFRVMATSVVLFLPASALLAAPSLETAIKATYLYKFAPFIVWPDQVFSGASAPFNICIVGNDGFADLVAQASAGQRYGTHNMTVRKLPAADNGCQILYIPGSDPAPVAAALNATRGKPILTVTDFTPDPAAGHGIVTFVVEGGHVRFDIDGATAAQDGLTISSKLLSLSRSASQKSAP